jgi:hypothetical protein
MPTMMQSHVTLSAQVKLNAGSSIIFRMRASSTSSSELGPAKSAVHSPQADYCH